MGVSAGQKKRGSSVVDSLVWSEEHCVVPVNCVTGDQVSCKGGEGTCS